MTLRLARDRRGSVASEFALVVPLFTLIVFATIQLGILFQAYAGLQHGIGEAARLANLWPHRTTGQISDRLKRSAFGLNRAYLGDPVIETGTVQGAEYVDISISYSAHVDGGLFGLPIITLSQRRRAFRA